MSTPRYRAMRILTVVVGLTAATLWVAEVFAAIRSPKLSGPLVLAYVADAVVWLPWSLIGVIIAARGVRTRGTTALAFAIVALGLNWTFNDVEVLNGVIEPLWRPAAIAVSGFIAAGAFLRSCQVFPRALTTADVLSPQASLFGAPWLQRLLAWMLRPWVSWAVAGAYALANFWTRSVLADIPVVLLGLAFLRVYLRVGNKVVRRRVMWIVQTSFFFLAMFFAIYALLSLLQSAGAGAEARSWLYVVLCVPLGIGGCASLAMAVFGAGAVNPTLVLRSTVVYGATIGLLLFVLNVIASVAVDSATNAFGLNDRLVAATLGALAGLLLEPLAKVLRALLERTTRSSPDTHRQ